MLAWNEADPVDNLERRRHERIGEVQGNHNHFIDRPKFAAAIWPRLWGELGRPGGGLWGTAPGANIVGTYDKDPGTDNQRLYLNGTRVAQMSDTAGAEEQDGGEPLLVGGTGVVVCLMG